MQRRAHGHNRDADRHDGERAGGAVDAVLDTGLRDALKALPLTGMLATLDDRLAQARDARLGHVEVLQLLLEDELGRRKSGRLPTPGGRSLRPLQAVASPRFGAAGPGRDSPTGLLL